MSGVDKDYLDAKFDGLKELMNQADRNMKGYVDAVSRSVGEVRKDLADHKASTTAHGADASERKESGIVAWGGFILGLLGLGTSLISHRK